MPKVKHGSLPAEVATPSHCQCSASLSSKSLQRGHSHSGQLTLVFQPHERHLHISSYKSIPRGAYQKCLIRMGENCVSVPKKIVSAPVTYFTVTGAKNFGVNIGPCSQGAHSLAGSRYAISQWSPGRGESVSNSNGRNVDSSP